MEGPVSWTWVILQLSIGFALLLAVIVGAISLYLVYIYRKYAHIPSPPRDSFFLGHVGLLNRKMANGGFFADAVLQLVQENGHTLVIFIMGQPLLITVNQEAVKELLVTGNFPKSKMAYEPLFSVYGERFLQSGLATETVHETWSKQRANLNPAFHRQFLRTLMAQFNQTGDDFMDMLAEQADGKTMITMLTCLNKATLDIIGKVAFSMDIDSIHDSSSPFPAAIFKAVQGLSKSVKPYLSNRIPFIDRTFKNEVREAVRFLRETGRRQVEQREKDEEKGLPVPTDVISYVIASRKNDPTLTIDDILDHFLTFFIAGQETTASALSFLILELGRHPDILQRVRDEVDSVIGERHEVSFEDISKLEYCSLAIKESLRLYPPAAFTFRKVDHEFKINGMPIPNGTDVAVCTYAACRLEEFTPDVMDFDPDRFLPDSTRRPPTYAYLPFSLGPRSCIGMTFAQIEAKVILVKFIQRFNFDLDPDQSFAVEETATLRPKDGTRLTLMQRDL